MTARAEQARGRPTPWRARTMVAAGAAMLMVVGVITPVGAQQGEGPPGDAADHPVLDPIDAQDWVDMADQTWDDYSSVRPEAWYDPEQSQGSEGQWQGAVILADFEDEPFLITQEEGSHPFGNPVPEGSPYDDWEPVPEDEVNDWFHSYYSNPDNEYNGGQTIHGYWMETSNGQLGIDMSTYGPYTLEGNLHEYGLSAWLSGSEISTDPDATDSLCPDYSETCDRDLETNAREAWFEDQGEEIMDEYDFIFFVSAGHDESSTWEEQGRMLFADPEDVPDEFGPRPGPDHEEGEPVLNHAGEEIPNYAGTRYVEWTSWMAAGNHWPRAGGNTSTQAESSGQSVFAHEFSHILGLPDNYNNPFADNIRNYSGYWGMMSRGTFGGPGGTHNRWQVPNQGGSGLGPHHMLHFKNDLDVLSDDEQIRLSKDDLADEGVAVTPVKARSRVAGDDIVGLTVDFGEDGFERGACEENLAEGQDPDFWCAPEPSGWWQGDWEEYTVEVSAQEGNDSFVPGHGVLLSQTRSSGAPYVWMIDPNPEDIGMIDYYMPDGTPVEVVRGDPRQINDATFHAGADSGSEYEWVDEPNDLHFYVIDTYEDDDGALFYDIGVRNLESAGDLDRGVDLGEAEITPQRQGFLASCEFPLENTGEGGEGIFASDVYRLSAESSSDDWEITLPNALAAAEAGETTTVDVHALRTTDGGSVDQSTTVTLEAASESDPDQADEATCDVHVRDTTPGGGNANGGPNS